MAVAMQKYAHVCLMVAYCSVCWIAAPDYPRRMTATRPHHIGRDLGWWWLNVSCNCMKGVELKSRSGGGLEVLIDLPFTMK